MAGDSPLHVSDFRLGASQVGRDTSNPARIRQAHLARLNIPGRPIEDQYREGKVKSTPSRGVKQTLNPRAHKRSERRDAVTACLLHNEPTSQPSPARLSPSRGVSRSESEP